jgi:arylsulfatase A-like enzyme
VGAAAGFVLQAASIGWAILVTERDEASARAAAAVSLLGDERWLFCARVLAAVTVFGAVVGGVQAALRLLARKPPPAGEPMSPEPLVRDVAWTLGALALLVLAKLCTSPALVAPALPLPTRLLTWIAAHLSPEVFHGLLLVGVLAALVKGLVHRRRAASSVAAAALAVAFVLGGQGCKGSKKSQATAKKPNVLVIAADSIRPDHLSALGYSRPTTPNVDRLIAGGTLFDHTMAPLAMTTPSWVSMVTGRYPHGHGIRHMFPDQRLRAQSMDALPKLAAENGYRTVVVSDYAGDFFPIFDFGFAEKRTSPPLNTRTVFQREILIRSPLAMTFLEPLPESMRPSGFRYLMNNADADRLADEVISELDADERPFFMVVFFSTTHVPFASRHPYYDRYASPEYGGEHAFAYNLSTIADIARADNPITRRDAQQLIALYDGALTSVDAGVGRILDALTTRDLDASTLVVFLSDHGENLFEPGQTTNHGKWFRGGDEANRVPLVLRGPNVAGGSRVSHPVSLVDVAPTLTEMLGWRALDRAEGHSLAPALQRKELKPRAVFAETGAWLNGPPDADGIPTPPLYELLAADPKDDGQIVLKARYEDVVVAAKHRAVWQGNLKLVYEPTLGGANVRLYDMAADPGQTQDLAPTSPRTKPMLKLLLDWIGRDPEREVDGGLHVVRRDG